MVCGALAALCLGGAARADIKGFNAAIKAGDYKAASVEAKEIWKTWDKTKPDTALMAREFGFAAYISGDYASAKEFGQFLANQGATLSTPDDQPMISRVLLSAAEYRLAPNGQTRQTLFSALKAREATPGIDMQTIVAAEALYRGDWTSADWAGARQSGEMAYVLIGRAGAAMTPGAMQGKTVSVTSGFLAGRDKQDYENIVEAHDEVVEAIDAASTPKQRQELIPLKFQLQAWANSVHNYFSASQQTGSLIPKNVKEVPLKEPERAIFDERLVGPDACRGRLEPTGLRYPESAQFRGMVGTVILKFDTDEQGQLMNTEVLAAVPVARFADAVETASPAFRLKRGKEDKDDCVLAGQSRVITFSFIIL